MNNKTPRAEDLKTSETLAISILHFLTEVFAPE